MFSSFFFYCYGDHRDLHSFPTRRSSDLEPRPQHAAPQQLPTLLHVSVSRVGRDRKSTRLNSSHTVISYAVFCLKKKKQYPSISRMPTDETAERGQSRVLQLLGWGVAEGT